MWGEGTSGGGQRGGSSPARGAHLVEARELGRAATVQVEAGAAGGVQPAVPGAGAVTQHLVGVWEQAGREVAAFAEGSAALLCVALLLEVLERGGAVGGAEGEGHARNMALVPERAGEGGEMGDGLQASSERGPARLRARSAAPLVTSGP